MRRVSISNVDVLEVESFTVRTRLGEVFGPKVAPWSRETFCSEKGQHFETQPALGARDCIFDPSHSLYMFGRLALYWE